MPALEESYAYGHGVSEADARRAWEARNATTARMLEEKGFGMSGEEPCSVKFNRYLLTQCQEAPRASKQHQS